MKIIDNEDQRYCTEVIVPEAIAQARYSMSLMYQKLFIEVLAAIDFVDVESVFFNNGESDILVPLKEFLLNNDFSMRYFTVNRSKFLDDLLAIKIMLIHFDSDDLYTDDLYSDDYENICLFEHVFYDDGVLNLALSYDIKKYFLDTYSKGHYFKFIKEDAAQFRCKYTMQLYFLCQSNLNTWNKTRSVYYTVESLRNLYKLDTTFKNFNSSVLYQSIKEINSTTNLHIETRKIKDLEKGLIFEFKLSINDR